MLSLEFCRISQTRRDALTLVIDGNLGTETQTFYALSRRSDPGDALCDLRVREGTVLKKIGFIDVTTGDERSRDPKVAKIIKKWAREKDINTVLWTDLESNFQEKKSRDFSCEEALNHLKGLSSDGIREAARYIVNTPKQVNTGFRGWLESNEWFEQQVALYVRDPLNTQ